MINILYIEDDLEDVEIIKRFMSKTKFFYTSDFQIKHRNNLKKGLIELSKNITDVILLDLSLSDSFGISTFESIYEKYPHIPIIVLSSLDDTLIAMNAVKMGAQDFLVKGLINENLIIRSIHYAIERQKLLVELHEIRKHEHYLAYHDLVTQLPNRQLFFKNFEQSIKLAKRNNISIAILFIDLDNFKKINDSLGHNCGDLALISVAQTLENLQRESDIIARFGGDEFIIALYDIKHSKNAILKAQKILSVLSQPIDINKHTIAFSASIGISLYPQNGTGIDQLINCADKAMYQAKSEGKNNYKCYKKSME